jgi:protein PhnA
MSIDKKLAERSGEKCELCSATSNLSAYTVAPGNPKNTDENCVVCGTCLEQISEEKLMDANHWRCLNDSMWSEVPAVQVVAWRMLNRLKAEGWPQDLLDMMYLDEETMTWAKATGEAESDDDKIVHRDSNGAILQNGDTVTLTKELDVKGATFSAKRGTAVRNIRLVHDNAEQIEGKIEGQSIVILTQYVKK